MKTITLKSMKSLETLITCRRNWTKGIVLENGDKVLAAEVRTLARY